MPEYSQSEEVSLEPEAWLKEAVASMVRQQAELLETDHEFDDESDDGSDDESDDESDHEDEYGMTAKGEVEPLGFVVETERNFWVVSLWNIDIIFT